MKSNASVKDIIRTRHEVSAKPVLTAEWNMNRYAKATVINTLPEEVWAKDPDLFPIDSIVDPVRPSRKGIVKAMVGQAAVSDPYWNPNVPRFYLCSEDDKYKYWVSPLPSNGAGTLSGCWPHVYYDRVVQANKIVVHVENSWGSPTGMQIDFNPTGETYNWRTVAINPAIPPSGRIELWYNGNDVWTTTKPANPVTTNVTGIRVNITSLGTGIAPDGSPTVVRTRWGNINPNGTNTHASIIEIGARLEVDLTDRVISVSDTADAGDASAVNPVGTLTSNTGDVTLWNGDNLFSENSVGTMNGISFKNLIEPNVEMKMYYIYEDSHAVQQFRLFTESWDQSNDGTVNVQLSDGSKYLKEVKPNATKYENLTFAQIVYRICDAVGFTDYNIGDRGSRSVDYKIPVFWTDGEQTVWEIFDDLSNATQSLIYFDEWGNMNVKTREDAFWAQRPVDWTIRGEDSGSLLADIISLQKNTEYEANVVKVVYKSAKWAGETANGFFEHSTLWEPEGTVALRSSPLINTIGPNDIYPYLGAAVNTWPFSGYFMVEGEVIKYKAKSFWARINGTMVNAHVHNQDEYDYYNGQTPPNLRHLNYFDGHLVVEERGAWDTEPVRHAVGIEDYDVRRVGPANEVNSRAGFTFNRNESTVTLNSAGNLRDPDYMLVTHGAIQDTPWKHMGTKFMINANRPGGARGGIVFNNWGGRDGYYVEVQSSESIIDQGKSSKVSNELTVYSIHGNNRQAPFHGEANKGQPLTINIETWNTLDVFFDVNTHRIKVYVNGVCHVNGAMPANMRHTPNGRFGMFIRGDSSIRFDYLYGIARGNAPEPDDEFSSVHRLEGMTRGRAKEDWVFKKREGKRTIRRKGKKTKTFKRWKKNQQFMDEFGPYCHEIREFDVKFDPAPVAHSFLYNANDWDAYVLDYIGDSFGASFAIANTSRSTAILNGSDETYMGFGKIEPVLMVLGRALVFEDEEEVIVENEDSKRARGEIVTEISSDWIQSEGAAKAVAEWISKHWAGPTDELSVEIFGNTLFQIGDLVAVEYPQDNMKASTHVYFVTGVSTSFDTGLQTTLTLRRRN